MEIRTARPADAERIRQVSARSCRAAYEDILDDEALIESMEDPAVTDEISDWLDETADEEGVVYLVATTATGDEHRETVAGFAQFLAGERAPDHLGDGVAYLKSLYVHPENWGAGVGTALLDAGIERLPASVGRLRLGVLVDNDIGRSFYEKHDFEQVDTGTFDMDDVRYETAVYVLSLDE